MTDLFAEVVHTSRGYLRDSLGHAGHALGLWRELLEPIGLAQLAERMSISPQRLRPVLEAMRLQGWAETDEREAWHLAGTTPDDTEVLKLGWGRLCDVLHDDRPLDPFIGLDVRDAKLAWHAHQARVHADPAAELANALKSMHPLRILDAGGGSGVWSCALLRVCPEARVTIIDDAETLKVAAAHLDQADKAGAPGLRERTTLHAADLRHDVGLRDFDLVVLAHVLHLLGPAEAAAVVQTCAQTLRPGGLLVLIDLALDADRRGPETALWFAVDMALYTPAGRVYEVGELEQFLNDSDIKVIQHIRLTSAPETCVLLARRPG
jgi:SAM-dependent methyltransferase